MAALAEGGVRVAAGVAMCPLAASISHHRNVLQAALADEPADVDNAVRAGGVMPKQSHR